MNDRDLYWVAGVGVGLGTLALLASSEGEDPVLESKETRWRKGLSLGSFRLSGKRWIAEMAKWTGSPWAMGKQGEMEGGRHYFDCTGIGRRTLNDLGLDASVTRQLNSSTLAKLATPTTKEVARAKAGALAIFRNKDGNIRHIEYSSGDGRTYACQVARGCKFYPWGWWLSPKAREKWDVSYGLLPFIV